MRCSGPLIASGRRQSHDPNLRARSGKRYRPRARFVPDRFDAICQEHVTSKRAKAFAFIFYDFVDQDLRRILKNQGAFAQLDRLAGDDLSVFYLHMGRRDTVSKFNTAFLSKLGVIDKATPPAWSSSSSRRTRSKRLPSLNWTT